MDALVLDGAHLTLEDLYEVAYLRRKVELDQEAMERAAKARQVLFDMAAQGYPVYGLNRGVGWNKDKDFDQEFFEQYNRNLINTHTLGVKPYCTVEEVRAILCIRLNTALCARTGISTKILTLYKEFLNRGIHPCIARRGSVGEADITTLSYIGQTLIGAGEVEYHGEILPAAEVLAKEKLDLIVLGPKDGLSIVSSNAQGEAQTAILIYQTRELLRVANAVFSLGLEGLNGGVQPLGERVNELRGLPGQITCAAQCRKLLEGSYLEQPDPERPLQDPLSFRCGSAIHGAVQDSLNYIENLMKIQLNATDDNPCIMYEEDITRVSQNFETVSLAVGVEMLSDALNHLSKSVCYRLIHLSDPAFTGLSRFLTPVDVKTIAYGTIQKVFTVLDAENRMLANPSSMDYMALAGTIEDHGSNLPLVTDKALKIVDNLRYMIGIEAMHAAQAVDLRKHPKLGKGTEALYTALREVVPYYDKDRNQSIDIENVYQFIRDGRADRAIRPFLND